MLLFGRIINTVVKKIDIRHYEQVYCARAQSETKLVDEVRRDFCFFFVFFLALPLSPHSPSGTHSADQMTQHTDETTTQKN